jgi:hypothetical protein
VGPLEVNTMKNSTLEEDWVRYRVAESDDVKADTTDDQLENVADEWLDQAWEEERVRLNRKYFVICLRSLRDHLQDMES